MARIRKISNLAGVSPELGEQLDAEFPYITAEGVWTVREEMARTLEDVLARRERALFSNTRAAVRMRLLARELGRDRVWANEIGRAHV